MFSMKDIIKEKFYRAVYSAFPDLQGNLDESQLDLTLSTQEKFGHYQFNGAMKLSKRLSSAPRVIASAIKEKVDLVDNHGNCVIADLTIAGPGFINITVHPDFLSAKAIEMLRDDNLFCSQSDSLQRVVIDFSSPNIAKEMHVGHLRSTIIGDSLARVLSFLGHDVLRLNHLGDWGTQFGMLISFLKDEYSDVLSGKKSASLSDLVVWYRKAKVRFDTDSDFQRRSQLEVVALQGGDKESLSAWKLICAISRLGFEEVYKTLNVQIQDRGESYYNPMLPEVIQDLKDKDLLSVSNGASCVYVDGFVNREGGDLPLIVQKSDGGYNYATTDLAVIKQRVREEKGDRLIYLTDAGQATHFQMVFNVAEQVGYLDRTQTDVEHVPFGLVCGEDGKKFKTRSGDTVKLVDLLQEAVRRAAVKVQEHRP